MDRKAAEILFGTASGVRAVVVGDLMVDEYLWGKAERISPEAPVQVVEVVREELRPGGAGNVVSNLLALGCMASVCSVVGGDEHGRYLRSTLAEKGVDVSGVFEDDARCTSKKTRVLASHQQIVRIDRESREEISSDFEEMIAGYLSNLSQDVGVILVSDYLKGVLTPRVLKLIRETGQRLGVPVVVDPKGDDYSRYRGATIITPNRREAEMASRVCIRDASSLRQAAERLLGALDLEALLVTRSEEGMSLFYPSAPAVHIPTVAREVYDVTGAGDMVVAVLGLGLACGLGFEESARLANVASGISVGKLGTSVVTPAEIIAELVRGQCGSDYKVVSCPELAAIANVAKQNGKRIVFTNGCFDLVHAGHVKYLQQARQFGDMLILGLNSDASVRRLKGDKRPVIPEKERAHLLAALDCVDYVVLFDEDTPLELITLLMPDVLVKGGDYTIDTVVGRDVVEAAGGRVELVELVAGCSTTGLIDRIVASHG